MRSGLIKKRIRDKNGRQTSVWVRPQEKVAQKRNTNGLSNFLKDRKGKHVVYHGTLHDISEFKRPEDGLINQMIGVHFAKDPKITNAFTMGYMAKRDTSEMSMEEWMDKDNRITLKTPDEYREPLKSGGNVLPVYLSIKNPLDLRRVDGLDQSVIAKEVAKDVFKRNKSLFDKWIHDTYGQFGWKPYYGSTEYANADEAYKHMDSFVDDAFRDPTNKELSREIADDFVRNTKYDGIIYENTAPNETYQINDTTCYIVFSPNQIKSATGNSGKYDPSSPDITKSE